MAQSSAPGDIEIQSFSVAGGGGSVDIRTKIGDFSVFQNIKKPYHSIVIDIIDDGDTLNNVIQFDGSNVLDVSFSQPGQGPYTNQFTLTNVEKAVTIQNQRVAKYNITGYSTHMTTYPKIQKSYKNMTGSDIIQDLIGNLNASKSLSIKDASSGMFGTDIMPYTVSGIQIWKAIRAAMLRSKSSSTNSSAYTLFEDNNNLVLDSLENALNNAKSSPIATYYQRPLGTNILTDPATAQFNIINIREDARVDAAAIDQAKNIQTQPFDVFGQSFSNTATGNSTPSTYQNVPYNIMRPPTMLQNVLPARKQFAAQMDAQAVTILVMLNPALTVGAGFTIDTLAPPGTTNNEVNSALNGSYLITEIRHDVRLTDSRKPQATTAARGVSGNTAVLS